MADKHGLNYDVRELKLGTSFTNKSAAQYHTIKYDFKPASVDVNKMATVDVGTNNQVTVTVPHLDGAGTHTVFKGSQRPYTKECVLIIDRTTGEITLEKLSSNVQVKKTRQESAQKARPLTPVIGELTNTTARSSSRTRVATNKRSTPLGAAAGGTAGRFPGQMGAPKTPPTMMRSPPRVKTSPPQAAPWAGGGNSTLASLPMIGCFDEAPAPATAPARVPERVERLPERVERVPERLERLPERVERVPERIERVPERVERVPERVERVTERVERVPERVERPYAEKNYHQERRERSQPLPPPPPQQIIPQRTEEQSSSSSSSDSDSGSGTDSDSDDNDNVAVPPPRSNSNPSNNAPLPTDVLNDDLCLSESESDSDRQ